MMLKMPGKSYQSPLPPLSNTETQISSQLKNHIHVLANEIGIRCLEPSARNNSTETINLYKTADYIYSEFEKYGYLPQRQEFKVNNKPCYNIITEITGKRDTGEIVVIGAHYDSAPFTPAANDNGSGVAALLLLAKMFSEQSLAKTLRFVAFTNEEPPFFQSEDMGSMVYARSCKANGDNITAMISLETIGYYSDEPGSQSYPFPLSLYYPSQGNFIAFVGNLNSKNLVQQSISVFRETTKFPSEGAALPGGFPGIGLSDHWSFWQAGYPAMMITDTALFRYPHYHQPTDTPDKLTYGPMAKVVKGLGTVVAEMVGYQGEVWNDLNSGTLEEEN